MNPAPDWEMAKSAASATSVPFGGGASGMRGLSDSPQLPSLPSVHRPHPTAIPEGPKVPKISHPDWHLPDIRGAQQGRHSQKVGWSKVGWPRKRDENEAGS